MTNIAFTIGISIAFMIAIAILIRRIERGDRKDRIWHEVNYDANARMNSGQMATKREVYL